MSYPIKTSGGTVRIVDTDAEGNLVADEGSLWQPKPDFKGVYAAVGESIELAAPTGTFDEDEDEDV